MIDPKDPYSAYRPSNQQPFLPSSGGTGTFQDWLASLPSAQQLSPTGSFLTGRRGETGIGPNMVPAMWLQFAPYAAGLINQIARSGRSAVTAGVGQNRREFERQLLETYSGQGINPVFARRALAESRPQAGYQIQQGLGGVEQERLQSLLGLQTGVQNALAESFTNERMLSLEAYLASRARKAARSGQKAALQTTALGSLFGSAGQTGAAFA